MKLYKAVGYDPRMCTKEDKHSPEKLKGEYVREIIIDA